MRSSKEIRADIERTRQELSNNVDAVADKLGPLRIIERQADSVRGAFGDIRDRVTAAWRARDDRDT